jgi:hypothetical protein
MVISRNMPSPLPASLVHLHRPNESAAQAVDAAAAKSQEQFNKKAQIIFWFVFLTSVPVLTIADHFFLSSRLFKQANSPDYAPFKLRCTELGIGSQALQDKLMRKGERDIQTQIKCVFLAFPPSFPPSLTLPLPGRLLPFLPSTASP